MTDYKKLGFKAGIEVHQQLKGKKLFCSCPTTNSDAPSPFQVRRKLRAVAGETGAVDVAAEHEMAKGKTFTYEGDPADVCLVELDEEPPHPINEEALQTALLVAKLLNAHIVDEVQVMRKTVIDGSNVSGFQRTALVGMNGYIDTSEGKVRISSVCLEEEACKKVEETKDGVRYRLDRLGIPLLEIATEPDAVSPEHTQEIAKKLGMILRSTGRVKRGLGSIRQDVNVSIKGGARVEIKGFQDVKSMPKIIKFEIARQQKTKNLQQEVRKAEADGTTSFLRPMPGAARLYPETDIPPITPKIGKIEKIELIEDKVNNAVDKFKIGKDLAEKLYHKRIGDTFVGMAKSYKNIKPAFIGETLLTAPKQVLKQFNVEIKPTTDDYDALFAALNDGTIAKDSLLEILKENKPVRDIIKKYALVSDKELEKIVKDMIKGNKSAPLGAIMGKIMAKYKGKVDGKKVMVLVKKFS